MCHEGAETYCCYRSFGIFPHAALLVSEAIWSPCTYSFVGIQSVSVFSASRDVRYALSEMLRDAYMALVVGRTVTGQT